jgi:hypothetical protein
LAGDIAVGGGDCTCSVHAAQSNSGLSGKPDETLDLGLWTGASAG